MLPCRPTSFHPFTFNQVQPSIPDSAAAPPFKFVRPYPPRQQQLKIFFLFSRHKNIDQQILLNRLRTVGTKAPVSFQSYLRISKKKRVFFTCRRNTIGPGIFVILVVVVGGADDLTLIGSSPRVEIQQSSG